MANKVITLGALPPLGDGQDVAEYEISGAHRLFNDYIQIRREQLAAKHALQLEHMPGLEEAERIVAALDQEIELLAKAMKAKNALAGSRRAATADKDRMAELKSARKQGWARAKEMREPGRIYEAYYSAFVKLRDTNDRDPSEEETIAHAKITPAQLESARPYMEACYELYKTELVANRSAYGRAQCAWGTRLIIAKAVEAACSQCTHDDLPKFRRWMGDGQMAVQLQGGGITLDGLLDCEDGRTQMEMQNKSAGDRAATFRLRVGSGPKKKPIWLEIPVFLPRNFASYWPADAKIIWVSVVRRRGPMVQRKGDDDRGYWRHWDSWSVQLTIKTGTDHEPAESGMCAVDFGWRKHGDDSVRVAYVVGDDGHTEELDIDPRPWFELDEIKSQRDTQFNKLRDSLVRWLAEHRSKLSAELNDETTMLVNWRSRRRMCWLVANWERIEGDDQVWLDMLRWRRDEAELARHEHCQRERIQARRKDAYRVFARRLADHYRTIVVCDAKEVNFAETKRRRRPEEDDKIINTTAQRNTNIASPGLLREIIVASGAKIQLSTVEAASTTCHICGHVDDFDRATELVHACSACGESWDQDENKCRNMLASARKVNETPGAARDTEADGDNEDGASDKSKGGRWQRRKKKPLADDAKSDYAV